MSENNNDVLVELVKTALNKVYENHYYLIEKQVHERSIVFWFGVYFNELLKVSEFAGYDLDFEYNKDHSNPKRTENFPNGTFPDIILHKRGTNERNLLIIEFKTYWQNDIEIDIAKLIDFTSLDGKYKYPLGLSILFNRKEHNLRLVREGKVLTDE